MPKLNVAPTKSRLLSLKRQLIFAEEGFDLLEQKRQILTFELMSRLGPARDAERALDAALGRAFMALRESLLDIGADAFTRLVFGARSAGNVSLTEHRLLGIAIPRVSFQSGPAGLQLGAAGPSSDVQLAMRRFVEVLPLIAQLAELQTAILRLARELRKTQRRCNALSKLFIPDYQETIAYITGTLEERERESFVILKIIRDRLASPPHV